jgi:hypothetical protein
MLPTMIAETKTITVLASWRQIRRIGFGSLQITLGSRNIMANAEVKSSSYLGHSVRKYVSIYRKPIILTVFHMYPVFKNTKHK